MEDLRIHNRNMQEGLPIEEREKELDRIFERLNRSLSPVSAPRMPIVYNAYVRNIWADGKVVRFTFPRKSSSQTLTVDLTGNVPKEPLTVMIIHGRGDFLGTSYGSVTGGEYSVVLTEDIEKGSYLEVFLSGGNLSELEVTVTLECWS